MIKVSILMATYNRYYIFDRVIKSILDSKLPKELELELVIVDDHSNEKTWNTIKKYKNDPRFIIHRNKKNLGSAPLNLNKGFELATGDVIMITSDDMLFDKNYIWNLYKESKKHDKYTCVIGIYMNCEDFDHLPKPSGRKYKFEEKLHPLTGIPYHITDGGNEHVVTTVATGFCYRVFYDGLKEFFHDYPVAGIRGEDDQVLQLMKLKPKRKIVVKSNAYRYHLINKEGGYRMNSKRFKKWVRINHNAFLKRNFGWRAYYMMVFAYIYYIQKWFRDLIGKNIIEKYMKKDT